MVAIEPIVSKLHKKWSNIQSIHIKTSSSTALPVYQAVVVTAAKTSSGGVQQEEESE